MIRLIIYYGFIDGITFIFDMNIHLRSHFHVTFFYFSQRNSEMSTVFDGEAAWLLSVWSLSKASIPGISHTSPVRWWAASDMSGNRNVRQKAGQGSTATSPGLFSEAGIWGDVGVQPDEWKWDEIHQNWQWNMIKTVDWLKCFRWRILTTRLHVKKTK